MSGRPTDPTWEILSEREVFRAPWGIRVDVQSVRLPDGRVVDDYYQLAGPDAVLVFAVTPAGEVVTISCYMHGARRVSVGVPAGRCAPGEDPLETAKRELVEETGYEAQDWTPLGSFVRNGNQGAGTDHLFLARGARFARDADAGDLEEIEVRLMDPASLRAALRSGQVSVMGHAGCIALGLLALDPRAG